MSHQTQTRAGLTAQIKTNFEDALLRTTEALKSQGFGVLTEIDVRETMKKKLDIDFPPYKILGACNPPLAHQALSQAPEVGLLLPCNVTVRQLDDETVEVAIADPHMLVDFTAQPALEPLAAQARAKLEQVTQQLLVQ
ncbi:MAG: DUF302 domain-containing protein [Anaerolineaceae bacterium]|nr:DUF302 domain-containing protein [Anaerolineaceae bacterium]